MFLFAVISLLALPWPGGAACAAPDHLDNPVVEAVECLNNEPGRLSELQVKITFSLPMDKESIAPAVHIVIGGDKLLDFTSEWVDERTVLLRPQAELELHWPLRVLISAAAASTAGRPLKEPRNAYFVTALHRPTVKIAAPADPPARHPAEEPIELRFSQAMEQYTTELAFSLREEGEDEPIPGGFSWNTEGTCLTFVPGTGLEKGRRYEVTVTVSARDSFGQRLTEAYSFLFTAA